MGRHGKILSKILLGTSDKNIPFSDLCLILKHLNFNLRIKGDHHIFTRDGVEEIINLQPKQGKAKDYQVKQVRNIVVLYKLGETIYD